MNFKLIVARALVSMAVSSASPALATEVASLHLRNACHGETLTGHQPMMMAHAAMTPSAFDDASPKMLQDDWPANLILD